jgi:hypothetical protein
LSEHLEDGSTSARQVTARDTELICNLKDRRIWGTFVDDAGGSISLTIGDGYEDIVLDVRAETATVLNEIFAYFTTELRLKELPPDDGRTRVDTAEEDIAALSERLTQIERSVSQVTPRLRCFLSYRFGDANELTALRVQRFLALLGVEVVTGQSYEPRRISEKIAERLNQELSFVVLLVTRDGESMWTRDEIATARSGGLYVIPLVEDGANFAAGLFGDLEVVPFAAGHVGDALLKLLEAVVYVRANAARGVF